MYRGMKEKNEVKQILLVIDRNDIMVKQFVAGIWEGINPFLGFSYTTSELKEKYLFQHLKQKLKMGSKLELNFHNRSNQAKNTYTSCNYY